MVQTMSQSGGVMIQFAQHQAQHAPIIGFAGVLEYKDQIRVQRMYLEEGVATPVTDGHCKQFFGKKHRLTGVMCGAVVEESGRKNVAIVEFSPR